MRYFLILSLVLLTPTSKAQKKTEIKTKSRPISVLILFMGDYKSKMQFDGFMQQNIDGILNETKDFISNKSCDFQARFQDVLYKKSLHLKINFDVICDKLNIKLNPEYVRLKDLKVDSSGFYLSEKHKNVQFKIVELKYK